MPTAPMRRWSKPARCCGLPMRPAAVQDLTGSAYTAQGFYLRMRYKFDEELLRQADTLFSSSRPRDSN
jgi:hypothetical protein